MQHFQRDPQEGFNVLTRTKRSEVATIVIEPGDSEGGPTTNAFKAGLFSLKLGLSTGKLLRGLTQSFCLSQDCSRPSNDNFDNVVFTTYQARPYRFIPPVRPNPPPFPPSTPPPRVCTGAGLLAPTIPGVGPPPALPG